MPEDSITPSIEVRIGRQTRLFYACVTSAPATLDAPSTMTLHVATMADVAGLVAEPIILDTARARIPGRLILVDANELRWQRTKARQAAHLFVSADPQLLGLNALQKWLWQRLQMAASDIQRTESTPRSAESAHHAAINGGRL